MHDDSRDRERFQDQLPISVFSEIAEEFDPADQEAIDEREGHRFHAIIAASCGTIAVLAAITELFLEVLDPVPNVKHGIEPVVAIVELIALAAMGYAVIGEK